jgi:uncharacterized protein YukE
MGDVQDVVSQIVSQSNAVDDVMGGIRGGMQPIVGGAWTGQGAEAFIDEVQSRLIPDIMALISSIGGFGGGINTAMGIVSQADSDSNSVVNTLMDTFGSIF